MQQPRFSIAIPCYNEAGNLPVLIERSSAIAAKRPDLEFVLVDNGSTDKSAELLPQLLSQESNIRSIRVESNQGYGFGILEGLRSCRGDFIGWTHADLQTDPFDILKGLTIIEERDFSANLFVKGQRRGRPLGDSFFTGAMGLFESCYLGTKLWDINAQPNIFHRSFFEQWRQPPHDFALDLYVYYLARHSNLEMIRFDVRFPPRIHGESKWNTGFKSKLKFIKRTFDFSIKLKRSLPES